jgi:ABC-type Mn2+/Zn2+ transport system permease subunit
MRLGPAVFLAWFLGLTRVFGGAALLWLLDAPAWAIAAWLIAHIKINLRLPDQKRAA